MAPGCASASFTADSVISWKTIRRTGILGLSTCVRCQLMASPSRSGSVASSSSSASLTAARRCATCFFFWFGTT